MTTTEATTEFDGDTGREEQGDCFLTAAALVLDTDRYAGAYVVHGTPVGTGAQNKGRRYWHAWVEYYDAGRPMVVDFANGNRSVMDRARYYEVGRIAGTKVHRYKATQVRALMVKEGTFGPWVPGWDSMLDDTGEPVL